VVRIPPLEWAKRWRKSKNSDSDFERHEKISKCKRFRLGRSKFLLGEGKKPVFYAMQWDPKFESWKILKRHSTENAAKQTCHKAR
jgi:hypothetical protein